jgi:hypothetical protein
MGHWPGLPVLWNSHFQCCIGSHWGPFSGPLHKQQLFTVGAW